MRFTLRRGATPAPVQSQITTDDCDCSSGTIEVNDLTLVVQRRPRRPDHRWRHHCCRQARARLARQHCHGGCDRGTRWISKRTAAVTGGDINVTDRVEGHAQGAIVLGNITAGPGLPEGDNDFSVGIASKTSITVGDITAAGDVGFATLGDLTTGNISAGDLILAMVGGDMSFGSLTTASDGRVYLADASMFVTRRRRSATVRSAISIRRSSSPSPPSRPADRSRSTGAVTTGRFQAAAGTDLSINDVPTRRIRSNCLPAGCQFLRHRAAPRTSPSPRATSISRKARRLGVWGLPTTSPSTRSATGDRFSSAIVGDTVPEGAYHFDEHGDIAATNIVLNAVGELRMLGADFVIGDVHIDGTRRRRRGSQPCDRSTPTARSSSRARSISLTPGSATA